VTGFSSPIANYPASNYEWNLYVKRFGNNDIIRLYTGYGPDTTTGNLKIESWRPYGDYPSNQIIQGLIMYTDLTFEVTNPIPNGGVVILQFSGVDLSSIGWKTDAT